AVGAARVPGARCDDADQLPRAGRTGRRSLPERPLHGDGKTKAGGECVPVPARAGDAQWLAYRRVGPAAPGARGEELPAPGETRRDVALARRDDAHELARLLLAHDHRPTWLTRPHMV